MRKITVFVTAIILVSLQAASARNGGNETPKSTLAYSFEACSFAGGSASADNGATDFMTNLTQQCYIVTHFNNNTYNDNPQGCTITNLISAGHSGVLGFLYVHGGTLIEVYATEGARNTAYDAYITAGWNQGGKIEIQKVDVHHHKDPPNGYDIDHYNIRLTPLGFSERLLPETNFWNTIVILSGCCNSVHLFDDLGGRVRFANDGCPGIGPWPNPPTDWAFNLALLLERMSGFKENGEKRPAGDAFNAGGFKPSFRMDPNGEGKTTLCPVVLSHEPTGTVVSGTVTGKVSFDTESWDLRPAADIIEVSANAVLNSAIWSTPKTEITFEIGGVDWGETITVTVDEDDLLSYNNVTHLDGNQNPANTDGTRPNEDDFKWSFTVKPSPDFGDAPDNTVDPMMAYIGVPGGFPSLFNTDNGASSEHTGVYHSDVSEEWLGRNPTSNTTVEPDALVPNGDFDDAQVLLLYDTGPPLVGAIIFPVRSVQAGVRYINVLLDQHRNGGWSEPIDYVIRDRAVRVMANQLHHVLIGPFVLLLEDHRHWVRITLTESPLQIPNWDGSIPPGGLAYGETEDHLLTPYQITDPHADYDLKTIYLPQYKILPGNPVALPLCPKKKKFWICITLPGADPPGPLTEVSIENGRRVRGQGAGPNVWDDAGNQCITGGAGRCAETKPVDGPPGVCFPFEACWPDSIKDRRLWRFNLGIKVDPPEMVYDYYPADTFFYVDFTEEVSHVLIPNTEECVNPGDYVCLPIMLENNTTPFGGFELEVEFDYTSMTFVSAEPGELIEGFELFTYRLLPCPACGCCKYKILLFGMYDIPNGSENIGEPIPRTPPGEYEELVKLCFVVNNDENLRGLKIPVCWEWEGTVEDSILVEDWECEENTFSSWSGDTLYTSALLCQFNPDICDDPADRIQPVLIFQDDVCGQDCGGVDICPAGPGECKRGDVNFNTLTYEVADAVLFASYFVEGTSVFRYDQAYQICATDVNADGRTLTLSDLVYLIRVILHDAVAIPKLTPSDEVANVIVSGGTINTECAAPIGAILFEFDGAVSPTLLADMEMVSKDNKVLVWSSTGKSFSTAEVLSFEGEAELVTATAVDRDSRELATSITGKVAPLTFALHPAYPNPFNIETQIRFDLPTDCQVTLKIYNINGQLVKTLADQPLEAGRHTISWDGTNQAGNTVASGVYFYKLTAADFSATEKMVMMK